MFLVATCFYVCYYTLTKTALETPKLWLLLLSKCHWKQAKPQPLQPHLQPWRCRSSVTTVWFSAVKSPRSRRGFAVRHLPALWVLSASAVSRAGSDPIRALPPEQTSPERPQADEVSALSYEAGQWKCWKLTTKPCRDQDPHVCPRTILFPWVCRVGLVSYWAPEPLNCFHPKWNPRLFMFLQILKPKSKSSWKPLDINWSGRIHCHWSH